jgi:hypothetical protein
VRPSAARRLAPAAAIGLFGLLLFGGLHARAEQSGRAGVIVSLDGSISPRALPRGRRAPIFLTLSGAVRSSNGAATPSLVQMDLAFGARGGLTTFGLAVCPRARLRNATSRQALERCRGALVGRGAVETEIRLAPDHPVIARASAQAFNGRSGGRPAVWLHVYAASPPVSFVLPFRLRRLPRGAYGLAMSASVRSALGRWPRLRSFEITLGRRYRTHGRWLSYLNASCPLPPSFHSLSVPMARATYRFAPAPNLAVAILRRCEVRE